MSDFDYTHYKPTIIKKSMTKEQFNDLWNLYVPENKEGETVIHNGVSARLADALKAACENGKSLAVDFEG